MRTTIITLCFAAYLLSCVFAAGPTLLVGPGRTYQKPSDAASAFADGFTMILDDGHYYDTFNIPSGFSSWTIKSASGNAYNCLIDGQGGVGNNHRLSFGKGIIHAQSPGTVLGVGFINGGGADGTSDGEAGFYAESFASLGTVNIVNCSFDGNENGIFVPGASSGAPGEFVDIVVRNTVFSKNTPNGIADGLSHNVYISGHSFTSIDNIWLPSLAGNNLKSRSLTIYVQDQYNRHDQGRCLDIPSGGKLTIRGGVYTGSGPNSVSNFFEYAAENTDSGVFTPDISGMTIVGARNNDAIWNAQSSITINFANTVQQWAQADATFNLIGSVTGIVTSPPSGAKIVPIPQATYPRWTQTAPTVATTATVANTGAQQTGTGTGAQQSTASSGSNPASATGLSTQKPPTKAPSTTQAPNQNSSATIILNIGALFVALIVVLM